MNNDNFSVEIEKLKKLEKTLKSDYIRRAENEEKNQPISIIDAGIRGQLVEIDKALKNINEKEINCKEFSQNEYNRRINIVQDINNSIEKMKVYYDTKMSKSLMEKNKANLILNSENKDDGALLSQLSSGEILKLQHDKIKKQDEMLDEFHGLLKSAKRSNQEIQNEIKIHTPWLENLEKQMDSTQGRMKRAQNKLNQYFEKSSNGCLMTTICIEVVLMLIIIMAL